MSLPAKLESIVSDIESQFSIDDAYIVKATKFFLSSMEAGLAAPSSSREYMPMIPAYVTSIPTGKEKGLFLAADLGGTNFRVCSIDLKGDHTFELKQSKYRIPVEIMNAEESEELFSYLAKKVESFLEEHHADYHTKSKDHLKLGFTFSFPVNQTALDQGTLIRWTKGFNIPDTVDRDVVELLQANLVILGINVKVVALANDTVGTLLSRAYVNDPAKTKSNTIIGAIFGTGTNGAYYETIENIPKLTADKVPEGAKGMVINTEWGSFDNTLSILPNTKWDVTVDKETANPGYHLFEKRISGMFLGEILRVVLIDLFEQGHIFVDLAAERGGSLPHRVKEPWQLDAEILSYIEIDDSTDLQMSGLIMQNVLRLPTTKEERVLIQRITRAISHRAAYLSAIPLAAIASKVKDQYKDDDRDFEFGCDGSVVEFYPCFRDTILKAVAAIDPLKGTGKKIHLRIAKDGSGVGAALAASTVA
ncbi:glucokinase GLK1 [Spathaspora passalidarum NRRL Y-27907]|uniref:Phosphotransferase n=1 Tax=Spathaspora passalidarum (strain NRRL Y-27907 / 11-Y1) TaxID=619300 RepID=G3AJS3_SPAPN|nr:glucokinase GLK1 [Spathaspora passalidarum NRRL Y-27907]EGW33974.1 glucokinase GLK1 [Spathaspora passalidarum NRRL Y-27907]